MRLASWRLRLRRISTRPSFWTLLLVLGLAAAAAWSTTRGAVAVPMRDLLPAIAEPTHPMHAVVAAVRLPRIAGAAVVGAALATAGVLIQTVVRNPLADAGLLGVSSGAGLVAILVLTLRPQLASLLPLVAFGGGLVAMAIVLLLARGRHGSSNPLRLLLSGVALQAILFAGVALVTFLFADRAPAFVAFAVGSLASTSWREVLMALPALGLGLVAAGAAVRPLDLLLLDDKSAAGIGLRVDAVRAGAAAVAALLAATAVAIGGLIGFVGLIVPNAVRLLVGPAHRALLPASAAGGALLVVIADLAGRTLAAPVELPVGALLALLGGPYFLYLLSRRIA